jgi:hypothetical protein
MSCSGMTTRMVCPHDSSPNLMALVVVVALACGAGRARADFTFSTPIELGPPIWSSGHDPQGCCFSRDGLELYFSSTRPGGYGFFDIWVATREAIDALWGEPLNLGPNVNSSARETDPSISPDGLTLYFTLYHNYNIRVCSRPSKDAPWGNPEVLGPPIGAYDAYCPEVSADGLSLYFGSRRTGGQGDWDIWVSNRATTSDPWSEPVNLGPIVNTGYYESYPSISSDSLALFFCSERPGGYGGGDIWVTTRRTTDAEWGPPINYPSLNQGRDDWSPAISPDGSALYFESIFNLWQSSITPVVDFNGDGRVNGEEVFEMAEHWGQVHPGCDIGPMPWGDGVVDVEDLKVLGEFIGKDAIDPTCIAHWAFDETAGDVAADSVGEHSGTVTGACLWCPDAGQVDGALQLDGTSFVVTDHVLSPADGSFSVLAWVQGGAPGQVIISQDSGSDWLAIDAESGGLMSTVMPPQSRKPTLPLVSDTAITDGLWHRIALVWDGGSRSLHVDGTLVAADEQDSLAPCTGGLNIGCGTDMALSTFFTGLIDDVRIYNRAVKP